MQLNFTELALSPQLEANLARHGFVQATPVQAQAIPPAMEGRDVVATAQTGTGKTLAFALPVIEGLLKRNAGRGVAAVILSPTRELALQIDEAIAQMVAGTSLRTVVAVGGLNERPQLNALRKGAQILIATPGRLCDFLQRRLVRLDAVTHVVLDEADRMLDMGFLPSIEQILKEIPAEHQTLFFSATIEPSVAHLIKNYLKDPVRIAIGSVTKPAEHVKLHLYRIEQDRKVDLLRHMLNEEQGSFLVFARTKHGTERLAKRLVQSSVKAAAIHGDRSQNQRNQALRGFQTGYYRVLVATDVAARGIHVDNIAHVVNFDLPMAPEDFIHRVGRTGRAGAMGTATTFASAGENGAVRKIEKTLKLRLEAQNLPETLSLTKDRVPTFEANAKRFEGEHLLDKALEEVEATFEPAAYAPKAPAARPNGGGSRSFGPRAQAGEWKPRRDSYPSRENSAGRDGGSAQEAPARSAWAKKPIRYQAAPNRDERPSRDGAARTDSAPRSHYGFRPANSDENFRGRPARSGPSGPSYRPQSGPKGPGFGFGRSWNNEGSPSHDRSNDQPRWSKSGPAQGHSAAKPHRDSKPFGAKPNERFPLRDGMTPFRGKPKSSSGNSFKPASGSFRSGPAGRKGR